MAHPLLPLNPAIRLLVYDHPFLSKITISTTNESTADPNRFPDTTTIRNLRLVYCTIKSEVDHHYAVIARQHYAVLARALRVNPFTICPVASGSEVAQEITIPVSLINLRGLAQCLQYRTPEIVWQFLSPSSRTYIICVLISNKKHPLRIEAKR
jgi:hypothetical protein